MDSRKTVALALAVMMVAVVFSATVPLESEGVDGAQNITNDALLDKINLNESDGVATLTLEENYYITDNNHYLNLYEYTGSFDKLVIEGNGKTLYGEIWFNNHNTNPPGASDNYQVIIKDLTLNGKPGDGVEIPYGIVSMDQNPISDEPTPIDLTIQNCTIKNYISKGIYLTSVSNLLIDGLTIEDCATTPGFNGDVESTDDPNFQYYDRGDYAIDIDITGIIGTTIDIRNVDFIGDCGYLAALKIAQRGGAGDASSKGEARIDGVSLSGLNFNGVDKAESPQNIIIGSEPQVDGDTQYLRDYNSAFHVSLDTETATSIAYWGGDKHGADNLKLDLSQGTSISVTGQSDKESNEDGTGSISITLERGSATASGKLGTNMSLTAGSGTSIAFSNFENTGGNTIRIESGADYSGDAGDNVYVEPTQTPGYDDDEDLPPFVPTQPADDDNTVTIVACAAAAAVAAILAVFLVIDRKP